MDNSPEAGPSGLLPDPTIRHSALKDLNKSVAVPTNKDKSVVVFKTPDVPPVKKPRIVLEEDKYELEMEKIIERDFFPDLEKVSAQNAYLNAVKNNDIHMLRELHTKYGFGRRTPKTGTLSDIETPTFFETPSEGGKSKRGTFATPDSTPTHLPMESPRREDDVSSVGSGKSIGKSKLSLNEYLDKYTSEDNQSFEDFMAESERRAKLKSPWLYEAEKKHRELMDSALAVPSMEDQADVYQRPLDIDTWGYRNKNYLMYCPEGVPFTKDEQVALARKKPQIHLKNTRFDKVPFKGEVVATPMPETPSTTSVGAIINPFKPKSGLIGLDGKPVEAKTPTVNGFAFVKTPSPMPGVEDTPIMTWGEIEGTPFRLDAGDTPVSVDIAKPFRIRDQSEREKLGIELADRVREGYRDKKKKAIEVARFNLASPSPHSKTILERLSSMSPAARSLAKSTLGSKLASDRALHSSYTPKRIGTPGSERIIHTPSASTPSRTPTHKFGKIPQPRINTSSLSTSTDNLLKLPSDVAGPGGKRPRASDFF